MIEYHEIMNLHDNDRWLIKQTQAIIDFLIKKIQLEQVLGLLVKMPTFNIAVPRFMSQFCSKFWFLASREAADGCSSSQAPATPLGEWDLGSSPRLQPQMLQTLGSGADAGKWSSGEGRNPNLTSCLSFSYKIYSWRVYNNNIDKYFKTSHPNLLKPLSLITNLQQIQVP